MPTNITIQDGRHSQCNCGTQTLCRGRSSQITCGSLRSMAAFWKSDRSNSKSAMEKNRRWRFMVLPHVLGGRIIATFPSLLSACECRVWNEQFGKSNVSYVSLCRAPSYEYIGTGKHVGHWHSGQRHTRQLFIITVSSRTPATSRVLDTDVFFLQAPVIERVHALSLPGRLRRNDV